MKYSLSRLLLEDLAPRKMGVIAMPTAEQGERVWLLNTYDWFKKAKDAALDKLSESGMELVYELDPNVRRQIDFARELVKKREQEVRAILADQTVCDSIWTTLSRAPESKKKDLAYCLSYYTDEMPPKLKIAPAAGVGGASGQSVPEWEQEVRLGCQQLKMAAAVAAMEDLDAKLTRINTQLQYTVSDSIITRIKNSLNSKKEGAGDSFRIDIKNDPKIRPVLQAADKAALEFEIQLEVQGFEPVFNPRSSGNVLSTSGGRIDIASLLAGCRRPGNINESHFTLSRFLLEGDEPSEVAFDDPDASSAPSEDTSVPSEPETPLLPEPRSLDEAMTQLAARYPRATKIFDKILPPESDDESKKGTIGAVVKLVSSIGRQPFVFPRKNGTRMGAVTLTYALGSPEIGAEQIYTGMIGLAAAGARNKDVHVQALDLVALPIIGKKFSPTMGGKGRSVDFFELYSALKPEGKLQDPQVRKALAFVVAALCEFVEKGASGGETRGPAYYSSYSRNALEGLLRFYGVTTLAEQQKASLTGVFPELTTGVLMMPGVSRTREGWISRLNTLVDRLRTGKKKTVLTTFRMPGISFEEEEEQRKILDTQEASPEDIQRAKSVKQAEDTVNVLLKRAVSLFRTINRTVDVELNAEDILPLTGGSGARLSLMDFCNRMSGMGRNMTSFINSLGYESNALIMREGTLGGIDVWNRMCDINPKITRHPVGLGVERAGSDFNASQWQTWSKVMKGEGDLEKQAALSAVNALIMSDYISPIMRIAYHASLGYGPSGKRLLDDETVTKLVKKVTATFNAILSSRRPIVKPNIDLGVVSSRKGSARQAARLKNVRGFTLGSPQLGLLSPSSPLAPVITEDGRNIDTEVTAFPGAPNIVDPRTLDEILTTSASSPTAPSTSTTPTSTTPADAPPSDTSGGAGGPPPPQTARTSATATQAQSQPTEAPQQPAFKLQSEVTVEIDDVPKDQGGSVGVTITLTPSVGGNQTDGGITVTGAIPGGADQRTAVENAIRTDGRSLSGLRVNLDTSSSSSVVKTTVEKLARALYDSLAEPTSAIPVPDQITVTIEYRDLYGNEPKHELSGKLAGHISRGSDSPPPSAGPTPTVSAAAAPTPAPPLPSPAHRAEGEPAPPRTSHQRMGKAIWRSKNFDYPVTLLNVPPQNYRGRQWQQVLSLDGKVAVVPLDELVFDEQARAGASAPPEGGMEDIIAQGRVTISEPNVSESSSASPLVDKWNELMQRNVMTMSIMTRELMAFEGVESVRRMGETPLLLVKYGRSYYALPGVVEYQLSSDYYDSTQPIGRLATIVSLTSPARVSSAGALIEKGKAIVDSE